MKFGWLDNFDGKKGHWKGILIWIYLGTEADSIEYLELLDTKIKVVQSMEPLRSDLGRWLILLQTVGPLSILKILRYKRFGLKRERWSRPLLSDISAKQQELVHTVRIRHD